MAVEATQAPLCGRRRHTYLSDRTQFRLAGAAIRRRMHHIGTVEPQAAKLSPSENHPQRRTYSAACFLILSDVCLR